LHVDKELEQIVKFGQSSAPEVDDADAPTSLLLQVTGCQWKICFIQIVASCEVERR
jgi:hypothetical protein